MDNVSEPAELIFDATIPTADSKICRTGELILTFRNQCLWLYNSPHETIYGCFYKGMEVRREDPNTFAMLQTNMQFAVKLVSIQQYQRTRNGLVEDPYNEIHISRHILNILENARTVIQNGIIVPLNVLSNRLQQNIEDEKKYYFVISQLANKKDLYENVFDDNLSNDMEAIRRLFKQMVKAINCLHNQLGVFHRDLSVENFVLNNDGSGNDRIFVIDFGQARVIKGDSERVPHDQGHFGKPAYTPPELVRGEFSLYWQKVDVWALGITLYFMLFQQPPAWSSRQEVQRSMTSEDVFVNVTMQTTDVWDQTFQLICEQGKLQQYLEGNGINYLPVHEILQNMLRSDPRQRWSTDEILGHHWLSEI